MPPRRKQGGTRRTTTDEQTPSLCPVSRQCGACTAIDVPYADQLARKQARVNQLFADVPGMAACTVHPIAGMDDPFRYRNKIASPFAPAPHARKRAQKPQKKGGYDEALIATGMYAAGTHRLVDTSACLVENAVGQQVVAALRHLMARSGILPYNEDTGAGFVRHVIVRVGHESGEVLVTVVTNGDEFPGAKGFARKLVQSVPAITTVVQNVNTRMTNTILGDRSHTLYGPGFILDTLCGLSFRISSRTFYQVNSIQTEVLYRSAIEMAQLQPGDALLDAYCGTGTIGLVAARQVPDVTVTGVDNVTSAIADARQNALHNGVENAHFQAEDAGEFLRDHAARGNRFDVLIMDPPRAGAGVQFLRAVAEAAPKRVVYISCNPQTQVRDVGILVEEGYVLRAVQPVDMFPHTHHIETVALMTRDAS